MSVPALSVVIPTRDRRPYLAETLDALTAQSREAPFEVIVVDDGSRDDTLELLESQRRVSPFPLHVLAQEASGPAVARNRGVAAAAAEAVLFLGDDTRPTAGTLTKHLET